MINVTLSKNPSVIGILRKKCLPWLSNSWWVGSERKKLNLNTILTNKALRIQVHEPKCSSDVLRMWCRNMFLFSLLNLKKIIMFFILHLFSDSPPSPIDTDWIILPCSSRLWLNKPHLNDSHNRLSHKPWVITHKRLGSHNRTKLKLNKSDCGLVACANTII